MGTLLFYLAFQIVITSISSFFCFFLPGFLLVHSLKIKTTAIFTLVLTLVTGIALFGIQGYIFGWLGIRGASYVYLIVVAYLSIKQRQAITQFLPSLLAQVRSQSKLIMVIIVMGVLLQSFQMFGNGLPMPTGMRFWRTNAYDGIYHLGLIESMKRTFPPVEPSSSDQPVINYHYWSDLVISEQSRLFYIPAVFLFFQWWPIVISLFTMLAVIEFVNTLTSSQTKRFTTLTTIFALLFLIFGSDAGWLLYWWIHHLVSFAYPAIDNGPTQFLNMPHTFGKLFFFTIGVLFFTWRKDKRWSIFLLLLVLSAVSVGLKVYYGFALAIGWMGIFAYDALHRILQEKKISKTGIRYLLSLILIGVVYLAMVGGIYLPVNKGAGGLSWYPLEWPNLLINRNNIDWTDFAIRIGIARYEHNQIKGVLYNVILIGVGLLAIHGSRAFGFIFTKRTLKLFGKDGMIFFYVPVLVCTFLGFTTLQVSGGFNVFNFFVVSLSILCVGTALLCAELFERKRVLGAFVFAILLLLCLPRSLYETSTMASHYVSGTDSIQVRPVDIQAFRYLRTLPKSVVIATSLEHPLESKSTYIAAFSGRQSYFAGKYLLETHNEPFTEKELNLKMLFSRSDIEDIKADATRLGITHIVIDAGSIRTPTETELFAHSDRAVYGNGSVFVYDIKVL